LACFFAEGPFKELTNWKKGGLSPELPEGIIGGAALAYWDMCGYRNCLIQFFRKLKGDKNE